MSYTFAFQDVPPPAPRGEVGKAPPAPAPATQTQPSGPAPQPAPAAPFGLDPMLLMMLMIVPIFLLMWWMGRSQQKKAEKALEALKKGDRVLTQSGLVGKLVEIGDRYAKLELAPGFKVEVLKSSLLGKDTGDNQPERK